MKLPVLVLFASALPLLLAACGAGPVHARGELRQSSDLLAFGDVEAGATVERSVLFTNTSSGVMENLLFELYDDTGRVFEVDDPGGPLDPFNLEAGQSLELAVRMVARTEGPHRATLLVRTPAPGDLGITVTLVGRVAPCDCPSLDAGVAAPDGGTPDAGP